MRKKRLEQIAEIIRNHDVRTQQELLARLAEAGTPVAQATISRDIRDMKIYKAMTAQGYYRYVLPDPEAETGDLRIGRSLAKAVTRVEVTGNLVVIRTHAGMAQPVALKVDGMEREDLLGCVAGDDTILVVARDGAGAERLADLMRRIQRSNP